jgi:hypothetical protein
MSSIDAPTNRIASSLSPEDPEIAFNHAAVLEASQFGFSLSRIVFLY